jgi:hypothetical protein
MMNQGYFQHQSFVCEKPRRTAGLFPQNGGIFPVYFLMKKKNQSEQYSHSASVKELAYINFSKLTEIKNGIFPKIAC